jgi:hypothetical protein
MREMKNAYNILSENMKGRGHLGHHNINKRVTVTANLKN